MTWKVQLDRQGVGAILRSPELSTAVTGLARTVASNVMARLPSDRYDADVVVEPYTTDRGAAAVVVRHPQARALEAKFGILSNAAAAAGLSVRRR